MNYLIYPHYAFDLMNDRILEAKETRSLRRIKDSSFDQKAAAASAKISDGNGTTGSSFLAAIYW